MSWSVDVKNHGTGDDFVLTLKEAVLPDGSRRPISVWLSGDYARDLDGLCRLLSLDCRVIDPAWIGEKLRKLLNYSEPMGDFLAQIPGSDKQRSWPSTIAYIAALMLHRYQRLGILDEHGRPLSKMGVMADHDSSSTAMPHSIAGKPCRNCGAHAVIRRDGCDFCTACGDIGHCG
jgi:ribonucleoside-diphosphate reductase alpha chain